MIGNAIMVARIATGEIEEAPPPDDGKDPAAKALGAKGDKVAGEGYEPSAASRDRPKGRQGPVEIVSKFSMLR